MYRFAQHVQHQFVGYVALFIALGGISYAAVALPRNSVGSRQIRPQAVKSADLGTGAVTSSKVKDGSLLIGDFRSGQLPAGARGAQGPAGPGGPAGVNGADGANGAPAFVKTTQLVRVGGQADDTSVTLANWELIETIGTFVKNTGGSGVLVRADINTHVLSDGACQFQVRVDGASVAGSTSADPAVAGAGGSAYIRSDPAASGPLAVPMAIDADFGPLAAGAHIVSVWVRGTPAGGCSVDPYNFGQERALVEEYSR